MSRPPAAHRTPSAWTLLAPMAVLVLLAIVVAASAGRELGAGSLDADKAASAFATLLFAVGAVWVAGLLVASPLLSGLTMRRRSDEPRKRSRSPEMFLVLLLVVSLAFVIVGSGRLGDRNGEGAGPGRTASIPRLEDGRSSRDVRPPPVDWLIVGSVFLVALAGFVGAAMLMVRTEKRPPLEDARRALAGILEDTLDDLRSERDPRRAVIAAYARMERTLGAFGLPRRPFEAPVEYLARVLDDLQSGSPAARRLTHLFERAKFSQHAIEPRMKEEAIDAVSALRSELSAEAVART